MKIQGVTESVVQYLRQEIVTGALSPGMWFNENALSRQIGVSRPPIREAFRKLEHENLVVNVPRKGTYVTKLSVEDCAQVFYARKMIECTAIDILEELNLTSLPSLKEALEAAENCPLPTSSAPRDMLPHLEVMANFHVQLVKSCRNDWLNHFYKSIQSTLSRYQLMYLNLPGSHQFSVSDHSLIFKGISLGHFDRAREHLKAHLERTANLLIRKMKEDQGAEV